MSDFEEHIDPSLSSEMEQPQVEEAQVEAHVEAQVEERQFSALEEEQRQFGWDPNGPKTAEQFKRDGELYREITRTHRKVSELERSNKQSTEAVKKMTELLQQQSELQYKRALNDLKAGRLEAYQLGDPDTIQKFDTAIHEQEQNIEALKQMPRFDNAPPEPTEAQMDFIQRHADVLMNDVSFKAQQIKQAVIKYEQQLESEYKIPADQRIEYLESAINDLYNTWDYKPQTQASQAPPPYTAPRASSVAAPGYSTPSVGVQSKSLRFSDLDDQTQSLYRHLIKSGAYKDEKECLEDIKKWEGK